MRLEKEQREYFGQRLRSARADAGMENAAALSRCSGVNMRLCYHYESGKALPGLHNAIALARACRTTVERIWGVGNSPADAISVRQLKLPEVAVRLALVLCLLLFGCGGGELSTDCDEMCQATCELVVRCDPGQTIDVCRNRCELQVEQGQYTDAKCRVFRDNTLASTCDQVP